MNTCSQSLLFLLNIFSCLHILSSPVYFRGLHKLNTHKTMLQIKYLIADNLGEKRQSSIEPTC